MYSPTSLQLADCTTLGVGGPALAHAQAMSHDEVRDALRWAQARSVPVLVLGGGSNLLVSDAGFPGLVLEVFDWRHELEHEDDDHMLVHIGAGVEWDELVAFTVSEGLAGIECLAGIPGRVGAAPIQNIGAYGQELSDTVVRVEVMDRSTGDVLQLSADACGFGYRTSHFKTQWAGRFVVLGVTLRLRRNGVPRIAYAELQDALGRNIRGRDEDADSRRLPSLTEVRLTVNALRRRKSMLLSEDDPNARSAGSFFVNPIISTSQWERLVAALPPNSGPPPAWPAGDGLHKLSAGWLIEQAGFEKGFRFGRAALSSKHALALINPGDATTTDLLNLAALIRNAVVQQFGVRLHPEPTLVGVDDHPLLAQPDVLP